MRRGTTLSFLSGGVLAMILWCRERNGARLPLRPPGPETLARSRDQADAGEATTDTPAHTRCACAHACARATAAGRFRGGRGEVVVARQTGGEISRARAWAVCAATKSPSRPPAAPVPVRATHR